MASTKFLVTYARAAAGSISSSDVWQSGGVAEVWQGRVPVIHDMKTLRAYTEGDETLEKADVMHFLPASAFPLIEIGDVAAWQEGGKYKQGVVLGLQGTARIALIETQDVSEPLAITLAFVTVPAKEATSGEVYSYTALAENPGGAAPVVTVVSKPAWLTATPVTNGVLLEGTPSAGDVGSGTVQLQADADGRVVYQSFTLSVVLAGASGLPAPLAYAILQGGADGDGWEVVKGLTLEQSGQTISISADPVSANASLINSTMRYIMRATPAGGTSAMMYLGSAGAGPLLSLYSLSPTNLRASLDADGNWLAANTQPMSAEEAEAGEATTQRTISAAVLAAAIAALGGGGGGEPAGAAGQIQFNAAGVFGASEDFVWDDANRRLGIGMSPVAPLSVDGTGDRLFELNGSVSDGAFVRAMSYVANITGAPTANFAMLEMRGVLGVNVPSAPMAGIHINTLREGNRTANSYVGLHINEGVRATNRAHIYLNGPNGIRTVNGQFAIFSEVDLLSQFGGDIAIGRMSSTTRRLQGALRTDWDDPTDAVRKGKITLSAFDSDGEREGVAIVADGADPLIGFLGAEPVAQQEITGSRGGNAALESLLTALESLGLIIDSTT